MSVQPVPPSHRPLFRRLLAATVGVVALGIACKEPLPFEPQAAGGIAIAPVSTGALTAVVGSTLTAPLTVTVRDTAGRPIEGAMVSFAIASGGGSVTPAQMVTPASGVAGTSYTLGTTSGSKSLQVTASRDGVTATHTFTIVGTPGAAATLQVTLSRDTTTRDSTMLTSIGDTLTARVTRVLDQHGNAITGADATPTWSLVTAGDTTTLGVAPATGLLTSRANGTVVVRATVGAATKDAKVVVQQRVASVAIAPRAVRLVNVGDGQTFTATARDARGTVVPAASFTWASRDAAVVTVNTTGAAMAAGNGSTHIAVASNGPVAASDSAIVRVGPAVVSYVAITPGVDTLRSTSRTRTLTAAVLDQDSLVMAGQTVTWSSLDPSIATVSTSGAVTSVAAGVARIVAASTSDATKRDTAQIAVIPTVNTLVIAEPSQTIGYGETLQLNATARDSAGVVIPGAPLTWTSGTTTVATVNGSGLVTALSTSGSSVITVAGGGKSATVTITVANVVHWANVQVGHSGHGACGVSTRGQLLCWGSNWPGYFGDGTSGTFSSVPKRITTPAFVKMAFSGNHTCLLIADGTVRCAGENRYGQLGVPTSQTGTCGNSTNGTFPCSTTFIPVQLPSGVTFAKLFVGQDHTCGLTSSGQAYCWGVNWGGQLGIGSTNNTQNPVPTAVSTTLRFSELFLGPATSCGRALSDGRIYCWGKNGLYGLFGNNTAAEYTSQPGTPVANSTLSGSMSTPNAQDGAACALDGNGIAFCWGYNGWGQLGDGNTNTNPNRVPVQVSTSVRFTQIATAFGHSCAVSTDQDVWCWGFGANGALGGGAAPANTCTGGGMLTATQGLYQGSAACALTPVMVSGGRKFRSISLASLYAFITGITPSTVASLSCGVTVDGEAYCWGREHRGIQDNTLSNFTPQRVSNPSN